MPRSHRASERRRHTGGQRPVAKGYGNAGRHVPRLPSLDPNPFTEMEVRKTQILEALRDQGPMTKQGILDFLMWEPNKIMTSPPLLTLLIEEGKIIKRGNGKNAMYYPDPDLTTLLTTTKP